MPVAGIDTNELELIATGVLVIEIMASAFADSVRIGEAKADVDKPDDNDDFSREDVVTVAIFDALTHDDEDTQLVVDG